MPIYEFLKNIVLGSQEQSKPPSTAFNKINYVTEIPNSQMIILRSTYNGGCLQKASLGCVLVTH